MTDFPKLYKIGARGEKRVWHIWTEDDHIYESYGMVGGKLTDPGDGTQCKATNVGRANERSPDEQTVFRAESKWKKKVEGGYEPESARGKKMAAEFAAHKKAHGSNAKGGAVRDNKSMHVVDEIPPHHKLGIMKGPPYNGKQDVSGGGYVQPKFDGVRAKASTFDGQGIVTSSNGNQYVHLAHIKKDIAEAIAAFCDNTDYFESDICLDGELYAHEIYDNGKRVKDVFKFVTSCCNIKASKPHPCEEQIKYHVFDIHIDLPQKERILMMKEFKKYLPKGTSLVIAESYFCKSKEKMEEFMDYFTDQKYEGLIFRHKDAMYIDKKKTGLNAPFFKYKRFQDAEFEIIGAEEGVGRAKGKVTWVCITDKGKKFNATQEGTTEYSRDLFKNRKKYIGKMLTVMFQDYSADGKPRFPIAKGVRDYE